MGSDDITITFASRNFLSSIEEGFGPLILPCSINLSTLFIYDRHVIKVRRPC